MSAQMIGQAVGGVFPALVDIIIVSLKIKEEDVGAVCFAIATLVLLICLISLIWVLRTPFFLYYYEQNPEEAEESSETNEASDENIFKISWIYLVSIVLTFSITLTIFPSVAVLVQSEISNPKSAWATKYFTPVSVFLLFNFGDLTGRSLASWINMPGPTTLGKIILLLASVGRLAFIPLFLYCNIVTEKSQGHDPLFQSDADFIAFMALFAVSNGYIGNICMLHGPKMSENKEKQEAIALLLIAGLVVGTSIGSSLSYPLVASL